MCVRGFAGECGDGSVLVQGKVSFGPYRTSEYCPGACIVINGVSAEGCGGTVELTGCVCSVSPRIQVGVCKGTVSGDITGQLRGVPGIHLVKRRDVVPCNSCYKLVGISRVRGLSVSIYRTVGSSVPMFYFGVNKLPRIIGGSRANCAFPGESCGQVTRGLISCTYSRGGVEISGDILSPFS